MPNSEPINDLVFPAGAARLSNFNDLATGTVINQITVGHIIEKRMTGQGGLAVTEPEQTAPRR